jgi:DNA-binding protein HU-beta
MAIQIKDNMNKSDFVSFIAEKNGCTKTESERMLNIITDSILESLATGRGISLVGFGAWKIKHRAARKGRNPKTGAEMNIPAYNQVVFSAGKTMKDKCN